MNNSILVESHLASPTLQPLNPTSNTHSDSLFTPETHTITPNADLTNKIQEINTFVSKLLDNALEEHQKTINAIDTTSPPSRDSRGTRTQEVVLMEDSSESECSSKSAPSPSLGNDDIESIESPRSSTEEERAGMESEVCDNLIQEVLEVNTERIDYGANFPGMAIEEYLEISNKTNRELCVELNVRCLNEECKGLEAYVYSVRSIHYYDASNRHEVVIRPQATVAYKVILKAPKLKIKEEILGEITVVAKGAVGMKKIGLSSILYIPKIVCPKELYNHENKCSVVKLAIKKGKKLETKFSLKNLSEVPVLLNLGFYQPKDVEENPIEFTLFPNALNIPAGGIGVINMSVKNVKVLAKKSEEELKSCKRALIGTVRNCALIYSFLLDIELHD